MNHSKIGEKYPDLRGLSHDKQLEIVKRAKQEILSMRKERMIMFGTTLVLFIIFGLIRPLILPVNFWGNTVSAFIPGVIFYFIYTWYQRKILRQKIRELVQEEK